MLASKNARHALAVLALWLTASAQAEFKVAELQPRIVANALVFDGKLDLGLTPKVEEALSKGIELATVFEIQLYRKRWLFWDDQVASWALHRNLRYHALSGQYLVGSESGYESFLSLSEALKNLGGLGDLHLSLPTTPEEDEHVVKIRVRLDIEALPAPLRPVAYTTPSWHLSSGWSSWNVAR